MTTPRSRDDQAVSSILGFIVGFALLAGSMAAVAYFMISIPEGGTPQEAKDLSSQVRRAADALASSPGHPHDWHEGCNDGDWETPSQIGLLRAGDETAQLDKLHCLQSGAVNGTVLLEANNLRTEDVRLYAEGKVVPLAAMQPPSTTKHALIAGTFGGDMDDLNPDATSEEVLDVFAHYEPGFEYSIHEWAWRPNEHPDGGLGNTFIDHAWHVHTQLIPKMGGIEATYTMDDLEEHATRADAAMQAKDDFIGNNPVTRWHIVSDEAPHGIPHASGVSEALAIATCTKPEPCGSGGENPLPHWTTTDGMSAFALLPKADVTGADDVTLSFDQLLRYESDPTETDAAPLCSDAEADEACVNVSASIQFWNETKEEWSPLQEDPADNNCESTDGWNASTSSSWTTVDVNLCEALEHTSGELWLGLYWDTECEVKPGGGLMACADVYDAGGYERAVDEARRTWFVNDLQLQADGSQLFQTDFSPGGEMKTFVASSQVDHNLHRAFGGGNPSLVDDNVERLTAPLYAFPNNGGNVLAFPPGNDGDLLKPVGLEAIQNSDESAVETLEPDHLIMRLPHELPHEHDDYDATDYAWVTGSDLLTIQATKTDGIPTLATGTNDAGAHITGVAYNILAFEDDDLREELVRNIYTSTVFLDPTFETQDVTLPESATVPVSTAQRVVLAEVTSTGEHQVPLEVTMYAWPEGMG